MIVCTEMKAMGNLQMYHKDAGILIEGYGLGVGIADINKDTWPDIYISNDFIGNWPNCVLVVMILKRSTPLIRLP